MAVNSSISSSKRVLIKKLFRILFYILIGDFLIGNLMCYLYFRQKSGPNYNTTYAIEKTNESILVFGNSRAMHHYIPAIISEILQRSCYNTGREGQNIFFYRALQLSVLKRYKPEIIILDFHWNALLPRQNDLDTLACLLPYYKRHPEIRDIVEKRGMFERVKLLSSVYPYNSTLLRVLKYHFVTVKDLKGYAPLMPVMQSSEAPVPLMDDAVAGDEKQFFQLEKQEAFRLFIKDARDSGIKIYIVASPSWRNLYSNAVAKQAFEKIIMDYDVPFWDFSAIFDANPEFFDDRRHLNDRGAQAFCAMLSKKIKSEL